MLKFELLGASTPRGGGWSGAKSMTSRVTVLVDDKVVASRIFTLEGRDPFGDGCANLTSAAASGAKAIYVWYIEGAKSGFSVGTEGVNQRPVVLTGPATFENPDKVPPQVLAQCDLDSMLTNRTLSRLSQSYQNVSLAKAEGEAQEGLALKLVITEVIARVGGSASGPKTVRVRATLSGPGIEPGSREFEAVGGRGGIFGQVMKSACRILDEVSDHLARQTALWVLQQDGLSKVATQSQ